MTLSSTLFRCVHVSLVREDNLDNQDNQDNQMDNLDNPLTRKPGNSYPPLLSRVMCSGIWMAKDPEIVIYY